MSDTAPSKRLARKAVTKSRPQPRAEAPTPEPDEHDEPEENGDRAGSSDETFKIRGGRTEAQRQADATSTYAKVFRPSNKTEVIKFLEDVPYACYRRHWVKSVTGEGRETNRPYVCLQTFGKDCPLCETGDRATGVYSYNVAICGDDGQVLHRTWDMGIRVFKAVDGYSQDPKIAPLTRNYFLVSKSGEGTSTQYNVAPVRATALVEDYDTPVPDPAEFDRLKNDLYTPEIITVEPIKTLRELARELTAEY